MSDQSEQQWYYSKAGDQFGPVTLSELRAVIARGEIAPADLAWTSGMSDWQPVSVITDLHSAPIPISVPTPAASSSTMGQWYFTQAGARHGPVSGEHIQQLITAGQVREADLAWREGMGDWLPIKSLHAVFSFPHTGLVNSPPVALGYAMPMGGFIPVYANFGWRFLAFIVDLIITTIAGGILGGIIGALIGVAMAGDQRMSMFAELAGNVIGIVLGWLYAALMESSSTQGTLGKMACGLIVTDMNGGRVTFGRATGRHFGKIISWIVLGVGYLMICWTKQSQGLHDIMAGTLVIKKP